MDSLPLAFSSGWASGPTPTGRAGARHQRQGRPLRADPRRARALGRAGAAGFLYAMEFIADKIPYIDSTWDAISTAIRPTVGAVIGVLLAGDASSLDQAVMGVVGGGSALLSHRSKAACARGHQRLPSPPPTSPPAWARTSPCSRRGLPAIEHPRSRPGVAGVLLTALCSPSLRDRGGSAAAGDAGRRRIRQPSPPEPLGRRMARGGDRRRTRQDNHGRPAGCSATRSRFWKALRLPRWRAERRPRRRLHVGRRADLDGDASGRCATCSGKSGRTLEAELGGDLEPLPVLREHRFGDDSCWRCRVGGRAGQMAAWDVVEPGLGARWRPTSRRTPRTGR